MTHDDQPAFAQLLADVLGFYGQATSPFALSVWWQACEAFELGDVRKAMTRHATDPERGHFPPRPADVIRQLLGSSQDRALLAWSKVLQAIRSVGSYGLPQWDEEPIGQAIDCMGGWGNLCRTDGSELPFLQRRFVEAYSTYTKRIEAPPLAGAENVRRLLGGAS